MNQILKVICQCGFYCSGM